MTSAELDTLALEQYRRFYAEEIRAVANIAQPALVDAFACVQRENFLGPARWQAGYRGTNDARDVYHNVVVALKREKSLNNGQPSALASWIGALGLVEGSRVFHVGCGSGYYTAIMAEVVGLTGTVTAAEINSDLAVQAAANLGRYASVSVHCGDGATFDPGIWMPF